MDDDKTYGTLSTILILAVRFIVSYLPLPIVLGDPWAVWLIVSLALMIIPHMPFISCLTYLFAIIYTLFRPFQIYYLFVYIGAIVNAIFLILTIRELDLFKKHP